jgi:hypothetical protein
MVAPVATVLLTAKLNVKRRLLVLIGAVSLVSLMRNVTFPAVALLISSNAQPARTLPEL